MISSERLALLASCWAAALVSAVALYAVVRYELFEEATSPEHALRRITLQAGSGLDEHAVNRLSFVTLDDFQRPKPPPLTTGSIPPPSTSLPSDEDESRSGPTPSTWSAEIRQEATPPPEPPKARSFLERLPWLNRPPQTAQRRIYSLSQRLAEIQPAANMRLVQRFEAAKAAWPPAEITFIAIKDEKVLELHARPAGGAWKLVHRYRVLAASGGIGPKLRQGDRQVPEGIYGIAYLNPNSDYHVSLKVNYPNAFDRQMAAAEGRKDLGGDIMIHGKNLSAGCLAVGDEAAEELFTLAAYVGLQHVKLIITPTDFRQNGQKSVDAGQPAWVPKLYVEVASAMADFKAPKPTGLLSLFGN